MNIGFFGDSFIEVRYPADGTSWPEVISKQLNSNSDYFGKSGTSVWRAYRDFIKHHKNYNVIVFCYSSLHRWPHLPDSMSGKEWLVELDQPSPNHLWDDEIYKLVDIYPMVFSDDLLKFICSNVVDSVNRLCKENNIYLINVFPYNHEFKFNDTDFPIVTGLKNISLNEIVSVDGKEVSGRKFLSSKDNIGDFRRCHVNENNNKQIGYILSDLIRGNVYNYKNNIYDVYPWSKK